MKTRHFKPIVPVKDTDLRPNAEQYWSEMRDGALFGEQANVTSCDFAPTSPFNLASTSGTRLTVFDPNTCNLVGDYSRFKAPIYSAKHRADGALLGVSTQNGEMMFFDVHAEPHKNKQTLRNPIRTFRAHQSRVNTLDFDLSGRKVFSMGDDGFVKQFDLASDNSAPLWTFHAHSDFVRAGAASPLSEHMVATGSYDHTIKLWDIRENGEPANQFDHGAPVERILYFPNGKILASAGGTTVKLWDLNTGNQLANFGNHNKTITSICLAGNGTNLLTGGIDCRINAVRLDNYSLLNWFKTESPVLALAISADDKFMAVGMPNRLAIYRRGYSQPAENGDGDRKEQMRKRKRPKDVKGFDDSEVMAISRRTQSKGSAAATIVQRDRQAKKELLKLELTEQQFDKINLGIYDRLLRAGSFKELVSKVLANTEIAPGMVVAVFHQIIIRQRLRQGLSDQGKQELKQLFFFLKHHLFNPSYFDTLYSVTIEATDIYAGKPLQKEIRGNIKLLWLRIDEEIQIQEELWEKIGVLRMMINWSSKEANTAGKEMEQS